MDKKTIKPIELGLNYLISKPILLYQQISNGKYWTLSPQVLLNVLRRIPIHTCTASCKTRKRHSSPSCELRKERYLKV